MNTPTPQLWLARQALDHDPQLSLRALAALSGLSPSHLQRRFTQAFGVSPAEYAAARKHARLRRALRRTSVTRAVVDSGYGSVSRVYEGAVRRLGMTPGAYARGGDGVNVAWTCLPTALGWAMVAANEAGVCAVLLCGNETDGLEQLTAEFPRATLVRCDSGRHAFLENRVRAVADRLAGLPAQVDVAFRGTAFQVRVWKALMASDSGQTWSYEELARRAERPGAVRAAACACARNRLAVLVPCHRVVRKDGTLGGYRWGVARKAALLAAERAAAVTSAGG